MEERLQRLEQYKQTVLQGNLLEKAEALELAQMPLEPLCQAADAIRRALFAAMPLIYVPLSTAKAVVAQKIANIAPNRPGITPRRKAIRCYRRRHCWNRLSITITKECPAIPLSHRGAA